MLCPILTLVSLCFAVISAQGFKDPKPYIESLKFSETNFKDAFAGLNVKSTDQNIDLDDLNILFYHGDAEFAKTRFFKMIDKKPGGVSKQELARFMVKEPVTLAVHECIYVRSQVLRRLCFADQILTYVYLVLDEDIIEALFNSLDSKEKNGKLELNEIKEFKKYNDKFNDDAAKYFIMEIGGGKSTIDRTDFTNYVLRKDLSDDFRECKNEPTHEPKYDVECLIKALIHYTMYDVTEFMTALLFSDLNKRVLDNVLDEADLGYVFGQSEEDKENIERFFGILDKTRDMSVTYGEFRDYIKSHSVKLHLERGCLRGETVKPWIENVNCIKGVLWDLIKQNHRPFLIKLPDLDMLFLFEELDKTNNGKIEKDEDLVEKLGWNPEKASKLLNEIDGSERVQNRKNGFITLDEFNYYVDEPNMVFGMGECLIEPAGNSRLTCFVNKLEEIISVILNKEQVKHFRLFYQKDDSKSITRTELEAVGMKEKYEIDNFLSELGMDDDTITKWEFTWFVKQQELSEKFTSDIRNTPEKLHEELLRYLKNIMTEQDIRKLFGRFDTNRNFELERNDFKNDDEAKILTHMNFLDKSGRVSILEFWLFLHTPSNDIPKTLRKRKLESECTQKHKLTKDKLDCYERVIKNIR